MRRRRCAAPRVGTPYARLTGRWYYLGSTGWWDDSYVWSEMYDACAKCGAPLGAAAGKTVLTRAFEGCNVTLDCTNATACVGSIDF